MRSLGSSLWLRLLLGLTLGLSLASPHAQATPVDFAITVPDNLSDLPLVKPTVEQARLIERAIMRLESCPVLAGATLPGFKGYEYSCIESNFYILLAVLATSVRVYSTYVETFPQFRRSCDTANMRRGTANDETKKFINSIGTSDYGLEKSCTDGYLSSLHRTLQSVFLDHAQNR